MGRLGVAWGLFPGSTSSRGSEDVQTSYEREQVLLAPYAMRSCDSRGRKVAEQEHPYRGPFQRDRDRILHSAAFRRLSGKMQVFTGDRGDYHRTRLTHTHEVASIARTIGRALRLNEDLIEALALFHDIGHPPFGHSGEAALDECLREQGGFSHNRYALTLVEELELRYPYCRGLNLTCEVLEGQTARTFKSRPGPAPLLEVQVVDIADSITYDAHDTDDAVKLGLVALDELRQIPLIQEVMRRITSRHGLLEGKVLRKAVVHELIDYQVSDVLSLGGPYLESEMLVAAAQVRERGVRIVHSARVSAQKAELESFLFSRVYRHPELVRVREEAQRWLKRMFQGYCERPELLPEKFQKRGLLVGLPRSVADYLAGMTDRYCEQQYERYFGSR